MNSELILTTIINPHNDTKKGAIFTNKQINENKVFFLYRTPY